MFFRWGFLSLATLVGLVCLLADAVTPCGAAEVGSLIYTPSAGLSGDERASIRVRLGEMEWIGQLKSGTTVLQIRGLYQIKDGALLVLRQSGYQRLEASKNGTIEFQLPVSPAANEDDPSAFELFELVSIAETGELIQFPFYASYSYGVITPEQYERLMRPKLKFRASLRSGVSTYSETGVTTLIAPQVSPSIETELAIVPSRWIVSAGIWMQAIGFGSSELASTARLFEARLLSAVRPFESKESKNQWWLLFGSRLSWMWVTDDAFGYNPFWVGEIGVRLDRALRWPYPHDRWEFALSYLPASNRLTLSGLGQFQIEASAHWIHPLKWKGKSLSAGLGISHLYRKPSDYSEVRIFASELRFGLQF